jgi:hypothetical protein
MGPSPASSTLPKKYGETVHTTVPSSGPSNQELCNRLRQLQVTFPSLQRVLSSKFHLRNRAYDIRHVNKDKYLAMPGNKIELSVRLTETSDDEDASAICNLRCLPSAERDKCFWALTRDDGTYDFVKFNVQNPRGYRKFNQRDGTFGRVIAKAIRSPRQPKVDLESIEISSGRRGFPVRNLG